MKRASIPFSTPSFSSVAYLKNAFTPSCSCPPSCIGRGGPQRFAFDAVSGEITNMDGKCLTAGWPFVQATAFETPDGEVVVVLLNEAAEDIAVELDVLDDANKEIVAIAPAHSVQTHIL